MFKFNNKDTRRRRSGDFIVNFKLISYLDLVFLLLNLNMGKVYLCISLLVRS